MYSGEYAHFPLDFGVPDRKRRGKYACIVENMHTSPWISWNQTGNGGGSMHV